MIDQPLKALLDEVQVSKIAEYLAERFGLEQGATVLQLEFKKGRYQRAQRLVKAPAKNLADQ